MARSDDLSPLFAQLGQTDDSIGIHQGVVLEWDQVTGSNTISVAGSPIHDVSTLTAAGLVALQPGDPVILLKKKSSWFILGRVVAVNSGLVEPQFPVVLYPQFRPIGAPGETGYYTVNAGVQASWEGRIRPSHPRIEIDGVWGIASGSGSVTYSLLFGGQSVGEWTVTDNLEVGRHGPFDIRAFIGQDWLRIELKITAGSGTGERAIQPLGLYFRQS